MTNKRSRRFEPDQPIMSVLEGYAWTFRALDAHGVYNTNGQSKVPPLCPSLLQAMGQVSGVLMR